MGKRCPADAIHIADIEGEGCLLAKEGDTHAQIISMEVVLSQQHPQTPHPIIHAQTIGTEPEAILGKPGAIKEGAHTHNNHVEPDLKEGQPGDPNTNTPEGVTHSELDSIPEETDLNVLAHLEGAGPEVLMDAEEDHSLEVEEDGTAGKTLSVKGDMDPHIRLQEPGVSCLATQEVAGSLTMSSPPPPTTLEAASIQRSLAVDTETLAIPVPDHSVDLEPQLHDTLLLPNEATEPPIHQLPEQIQAPTRVGGLLESLPGEESQCTMGQRGLTSARTHEGKEPIREAHSHPPDIPNPQRQAPSFGSQHPLFRRPVSARIRCRGLSPTRVLVCALICGPAWAPSPSIQTSVLGQYHSLRGSKTFTYHVWGASCMLPYLPLNIFHYHPYPPFHHLTLLHARIRHMEKALPLSSAPSKTVPIPNPQNHLTHMAKVCRKQGECHQYWATHLHFQKTLTLSDFLA